jgi:hypothetical protein
MLKECFEVLLEIEMVDEEDAEKPKKRTGAEMMALKAFRAALEGDWNAWKLVRDTSGQKPSEKLVSSEIDPAVIAEVERQVYGEG